MARAVYHKIPIEERGFLHGIREVARYMGCSGKTVLLYYEKNGLPLIVNNKGMYMVSKTLIDTWLITLWGLQMKARGLPPGSSSGS
jgi:hypothetical protein